MTKTLHTYAGGFKVPKVNTIDFRHVLINFQGLISAKPSTFATVLCLLAIWVLLSVWARRTDRKDVEKVSALSHLLGICHPIDTVLMSGPCNDISAKSLGHWYGQVFLSATVINN